MGVASVLSCTLPWVVELVCEVACTFCSWGHLQWARPQCQPASESHEDEDSLSEAQQQKRIIIITVELLIK